MPVIPANTVGTIFQHTPAAKDFPIRQTAALTLKCGISDRDAAALLLEGRVIEALETTGGNICRAACLLDVHRNTVARRLADLHLQRLPGEIRRRARENGEAIGTRFSHHRQQLKARLARAAEGHAWKNRCRLTGFGVLWISGFR